MKTSYQNGKTNCQYNDKNVFFKYIIIVKVIKDNKKPKLYQKKMYALVKINLKQVIQGHTF